MIAEPESRALRAFVGRRPTVASALVRVEVPRAIRRHDRRAVPRVGKVLASLTLIAVSDQVLDQAAALEPESLRSLDGIHLATAQALGSQLEAVITYDARLGRAAELLGMRVVAPAGRPSGRG